LVKKFQSVLSFGDSHVAGCELTNGPEFEQYLNGHITLEQADAVNKPFAFPDIVAKSLGIPSYNYSISGGSNQRSIRRMIEAVQEHPNSLVLFGYTSPDRNELYYPEKGRYLGKDDTDYLQLGIQWQGAIADASKGKLNSSINEYYVNNMVYPKDTLQDTFFIVDCIATMYALDIRHLKLFPTIERFEDEMDFEGFDNYVKWCEHKKFSKMPFLHYGQDAHNALAQLILKDL
jgi:hypothetical protein